MWAIYLALVLSAPKYVGYIYLVENCLKLKDIVVPRDFFLLHQWCTILGASSPWRLNFER